MIHEVKQQVPEWFPERFFESSRIKENVEKDGELIIDWHITKPSMIATINYIRTKGYKCEWIEKATDQYLIKITSL